MSVHSEVAPAVRTAEWSTAVARSAAVVRRRHRTPTSQWVAGVLLSILVFVGLFPFLFMFVASFKTNQQFYSSYWAPAWPLHLGNYGRAWRQIQPYFITTVLVALGAIVGTLLLATTAGFVFARYSFPGRKLLFALVAALLMVPSIASLIPLFVLMQDLGLLNTRTVLVLPQITGNVVLGTILIKTFTEGIPQELFDAARVDGADGVRVFRSVMVPLSLPVLGTVTLITVINVWNDFFWPLLTVTQNNKRTISPGLSFFQGQNVTSFGPLFAGYTLASIPLLLLFTFLSKYFLAGIQGGVPAASK